VGDVEKKLKRVRRKEKDGFLSVMDACILTVMIIVVSFFIFQGLSVSLSYRSEPRRSEFERESVMDIQNAVIRSQLEETGYLKVHGPEGAYEERVSYDNITVDTAIKNYLYLKNKSDSENLFYDLTELEQDIKGQYKRCAWEISRYHFAVEAEHGSTNLFISDIEEVRGKEDLPDSRSAYSSYSTLNLERVLITLYIWR